MSPPKSRQSDPRNTHMPSFSLVTPVAVQPCSPGWGSWLSAWPPVGAVVVAVSAAGALLFARRGCGVGGVGFAARQLRSRAVAVVVPTGVVAVVVVVTGRFGVVGRLEAPAVDR